MLCVVNTIVTWDCVRLNGNEIGAHPLVALGDAVPGSWAVKAYDTLRLWVR